MELCENMDRLLVVHGELTALLDEELEAAAEPWPNEKQQNTLFHTLIHPHFHMRSSTHL